MTLSAGFDVLVCGSLHLDIVVNAPALPRIDETAVGHAWKQVCGGKGGNQAVQAARAGARTAMLGRIGNDEFGKTLLANLVHSNVDVSAITVDPVQGTGMSVAILQDNGDYGAVIVSGANLTIDVDILLKHFAELENAKVLVLQNEVRHPVNVAMARLARSAGALVLLNAAPARDFGNDILDNVDVLVVNRIEAAAMCSFPIENRASAREVIMNLTGPSRAVIVTLGAEGLVVATKTGDVIEIPSIPVQVKSTHGAGDCFLGVLAAELAKGQSLIDACRTANAAAAAFVSRV